jgi:hypothetical protein
MLEFLKNAVSEPGGTPSATRISLWIVVSVICGVAIYFLVRNWFFHEVVDLPKNLSDLLSVSVGSLSAARIGGRFAENQSP